MKNAGKESRVFPVSSGWLCLISAEVGGRIT